MRGYISSKDLKVGRKLLSFNNKSIMKNCNIFLIFFGAIGLFTNCSKEPIYPLPPPVQFKNWSGIKDTVFNFTGTLSQEPCKIRAVSNYSVLFNGADTATSIRISFTNNSLGLEDFIFKFVHSKKNINGAYDKLSIVNVYTETNKAVFESKDIVIDSLYFETTSLNNLFEFEIKNLHVDFHTTSTSTLIQNIQGEIISTNLKVQKTYFQLYQKGKEVPTEKELLNVDLKGGGEYNPRPLFDYIPDLRNPNDLLFLNIPTKMVEQLLQTDVQSNLQYRSKGKFIPASSGIAHVHSFYYKNSIHLTGSNWHFKDTNTLSTVLLIDSLKLQFYSMPF